MSNKSKSSLGKTLIKAQKKKRGRVTEHGFVHSADLRDGLDWARLNLRSVTEQTSVDDFLDKVKLADQEYSQEFDNVQILTPEEVSGELTENDRKLIAEAQESHKDVVCIPRRPLWDITTTKEELNAKEKEEFLNWRRKLALLREEKHIRLTPYEKNLEIWRQLWRVIEKSDVIVQILDARNPLLFRCEDLESYVKEVDKKKRNILLLNKADFLSENQRQLWADYFEKDGVNILFFSALEQAAKASDDELLDDTDDLSSLSETESDPSKDSKSHKEESEPSKDSKFHKEESEPSKDSKCYEEESVLSEPLSTVRKTRERVPEENETANETTVRNSSQMYSKDDLITYFKQFKTVPNNDTGIVTVGLVGYPNVGKSSTINAVLSSKKVQVSATPGKTKHFQTLMLDPELCLCDCPGLVFPSFVSSKADMIINGILPIDQLTEAFAPVNLICKLIPRPILERTYHILLPTPTEGKNVNCPPTADELLSAFGYMRGFMTHRGLPDTSRSARYILKDFVNGKLIYCNPPPGICDADYQSYFDKISYPHVNLTADFKVSMPKKVYSKSEEIDRNFFCNTTSQMHIKGAKPISGYAFGYTRTDQNSVGDGKKPWKKHYNKNKKEKLRRLFPNALYQQ